MLAGNSALVTGGGWLGWERAGSGLEAGCGVSAGAVNPDGEGGKDTRRAVKAQPPVCSADESGS